MDKEYTYLCQKNLIVCPAVSSGVPTVGRGAWQALRGHLKLKPEPELSLKTTVLARAGSSGSRHVAAALAGPWHSDSEAQPDSEAAAAAPAAHHHCKLEGASVTL